MTPPSRQVGATAFVYGRDPVPREVSVPVETPVEIAYGGVPFAVMMLTPADLEDFAVGFSLTEGTIRSAAEVRSVEIEPRDGGVRVDIRLAPDRMQRHLARRRAISGRTGCGICGIEDLASLGIEGRSRVRQADLDLGAVERSVEALDIAQVLNRDTRAVHAAAWADRAGRLVAVREDVGRHNALDKLVGHLARRDSDPADGFVVITSRCSFEMVDKAAAFGAGAIVAVSAPTSLAIDRAERLGVLLLGVARRDGVTAFVGADRVGDQAVPQPREDAA